MSDQGLPCGEQYLDALGVRLWVRRGLEVRPAAPSAGIAGQHPTSTASGPAVAPAPVQAARREQDHAAVTSAAEPSNSPLAASIASAAPVAMGRAFPGDWQQLIEAVSACTACELHAGRTQSVFGVGDAHADWMLIGEAPGAEEDRRGEPFVGPSGQLLDKMLQAVGHSREQVFISNILKCRPPGNRDPVASESLCCRPYLDRQIELVAPRVILAVGRVAAQNLLNTDQSMAALRGRVHQYGSIPLIVSYHPAYLLRAPSEKRKAWQDLLMVRQLLEAPQ